MQIAVVATPDGRADAVSTLPGTGEEVFALPAEGSMTMADLLENLTGKSKGKNRLYMQQQNDCLRANFLDLEDDIMPMLPWADTAFGGPPEAVNLWIGGQESVTTFHKDHYENMFAVISGAKTFHLLPPSDYYRLGIQEYPVAQYEADDLSGSLAGSSLQLRKQESRGGVNWSPLDPRPGHEGINSPIIDPSLPPPLVVTVNAGEVLYLPSMWHHFVEQHNGPEGCCIAVNFWYDMVIDTKFAHYALAEKLADLCRH